MTENPPSFVYFQLIQLLPSVCCYNVWQKPNKNCFTAPFAQDLTIYATLKLELVSPEPNNARILSLSCPEIFDGRLQPDGVKLNT